VPLVSGEDVIAILGIANQTEDACFSNTEVEQLESFAHMASIALENTQLNERTFQDLNRSKALFEVSQVLANRANTKSKLKDICKIIFELLDACWVVINDCEPEHNIFNRAVIVDHPDCEKSGV